MTRVGAPALAIDHRTAERLADPSGGSAPTARPDHQAPVVQRPCALDRGSTQPGAQPLAAVLGSDGDPELAGRVDPHEPDDATALDRRQSEAVPLSQRGAQRRKRLGVGAGGRSEVAGLGP